VDAPADRTLLDVLRTERGLRSVSRGCTDGSCGACRVLVDGEIVSSCRVRWQDVPEGARIEAYESLAEDPAAKRAVDAFAAERPTRCRLCVGALAVTAVSLARAGRAGDLEAIDASLETATCMCTGRGSWRRALLK
jgi:aerobic-type carbon monoxide dehydrogenase small subunit (CoxS/CutS family)